MPSTEKSESSEDLDRRIVLATQRGLPLDAKPYQWLGQELGVPQELVMERINTMLGDGRIRRIGTVPNHYRLGYVANGMSVWDIPDNLIQEVGQQVGHLEMVSHCYHRARHLPDWPYNLFAMVHGQTQAEVHDKVDHIAQLLGDRNRQHDVLFSTRILKKSGLRIGA
ncbi:MAG: Lrp/AsnC family transcriptional regulator [Granulosicoccus sp.]